MSEMLIFTVYMPKDIFLFWLSNFANGNVERTSVNSRYIAASKECLSRMQIIIKPRGFIVCKQHTASCLCVSGRQTDKQTDRRTDKQTGIKRCHTILKCYFRLTHFRHVVLF